MREKAKMSEYELKCPVCHMGKDDVLSHNGMFNHLNSYHEKRELARFLERFATFLAEGIE